MIEPDYHRELADLRTKLGELEGTVRVIKHDLANVQLTQQGFGTKLDRVEERLGGKIDMLIERVAAVNLKHERGAGFFAGIALVFTSCGALLLALGKLLFGGAQ